MGCPTLERILILERDAWYGGENKEWQKVSRRLWKMLHYSPMNKQAENLLLTDPREE